MEYGLIMYFIIIIIWGFDNDIPPRSDRATPYNYTLELTLPSIRAVDHKRKYQI